MKELIGQLKRDIHFGIGTIVYNIRAGLYLDIFTCSHGYHKVHWENDEGMEHCYCYEVERPGKNLIKELLDDHVRGDHL
jgi:hypothetical protein